MGASRTLLARRARDTAARILYSCGVTVPKRVGRALLTVVTFHRVLDREILRRYPLPQLGVTTDEFRWLIEFFARNYTCGALRDVHVRWTAGEQPVLPFLAITFDDGQLDNFENARPVLERVGVRATFFVVPDAVDSGAPLWHDALAHGMAVLLAGDRAAARRCADAVGAGFGGDEPSIVREVVSHAKRLDPTRRAELLAEVCRHTRGSTPPPWAAFMNWEQLRSLSRAGHEIGSHSSSHALLPLLPDQDLVNETTQSRRRIEAVLGARCESFCYPNGDCDARVVAAVRRAGYERAVTTRWGPNRLGVPALELTRCDLQGRLVRDTRGALSEARLALRLSRYFPGPRP